MQRGSSTSACASCKHQRKKCVDKCVLAPFFPVDRTREFQAVHKVFGVSNITKIVTNLKEEDRKRAVDSLIWEALCRLKDPVLGPYGEYRRVCEELRLYKTQFQTLHHHVPPQGNPGPAGGGSGSGSGSGVVYKGAVAAAHGLVGWGNGNGKVVSSNGTAGGMNNIGYNSSSNNFHHGKGNNGVVEYCSSRHVQDAAGALRAESDNGSALILPDHHLATNGFNQQYFLTAAAAGQYNPMDSKSIESTLWEGSS